jgi:PqqD family protein of HPr-rel-A system
LSSPASPDGDLIWCPVAPNALAWRLWNDELVVYNDLTGSTHHLSTLGCIVMQELVSHPSGIAVSTLVHGIALDVGTTVDAILAQAVERTLAELAEIRLAAPAT